jgi:hypothetical protein
MIMGGSIMSEPMAVDATISFETPLEIDGKNGTIREADLRFTSPALFVILTGSFEALS